MKMYNLRGRDFLEKKVRFPGRRRGDFRQGSHNNLLLLSLLLRLILSGLLIRLLGS